MVKFPSSCDDANHSHGETSYCKTSSPKALVPSIDLACDQALFSFRSVNHSREERGPSLTKA